MYAMIPSLICDFYKTSHRLQYPAGTEFIYSTMVPRNNKYLPKVDRVVSSGVTGFVRKLPNRPSLRRYNLRQQRPFAVPVP